MLATLFGLLGCGGSKTAPVLRALIDEGLVDLQVKTEGHQRAWRFGEEEHWDFDQDVGELIFSFGDGTTASAAAQIIGTWDSHGGTWMWAWANPSVEKTLSRDALTIRAHGEQHGIKKLTSPKWKCGESEVWDMAALATKLCNAQGAYRGPAGDTFVLFTFGEVKLSKAE